jgi:hypothetical protein
LERENTESTDYKIVSAINKALLFMKSTQLPNGGFSCLMAFAQNCACEDLNELLGTYKRVEVIDDEYTVFPSTLIGHALLSTFENPMSKSILTGIGRFLIDNQKPFGLWCHYTKSHQLGHMIPSDLDNTAMASKLLEELGIPFTNNKSLIQSNTNKKNQFFTWITIRFQLHYSWKYWLSVLKEIRHPIGHFYYWNNFPSNKNDVDVVVNSNVLYYLGENEFIQGAIDLMVEVIEQGNEAMADKWYPRPILVYYYISKNFKKYNRKLLSIRPRIIERIKENLKQNGQIFDSVLDTALAISALQNMHQTHEVPAVSIQYLIDSQKENGSWNKWVMFYGNPNKSCGYGSDALTTAHVVEALALYKEYLTNTARD